MAVVITPLVFEGPPQDNFYDAGLAEQLPTPICVDEVLYWLSITCPDANKMVLYYLNLKDNSYGNFPFPEGDKVGKDEKGATIAKLVELQAYLCIQCSSLMYKGFLVYTLEDAKLGFWEQVFSIPYPPGIIRRWIFLLRARMSEDEFKESMSYTPAMSYKTPKCVGFFTFKQ